jgi:hypothetical protein
VTMTELTQQQSLGHRAQLFPVLDSKTWFCIMYNFLSLKMAWILSKSILELWALWQWTLIMLSRKYVKFQPFHFCGYGYHLACKILTKNF